MLRKHFADLRGLTMFLGVTTYQCEAMLKRLESEARTAAAEFSLPRSGSAPLVIKGELLAEGNGQNPTDKRVKRWHELSLFRASAGQYVVAIHFRCETRHDDPYDEAEVFDNPQDVVSYLEEFDPV